MSGFLIIVVTVIYLLVSVSLLIEGKPGMILMFFGYALANGGVLWSLR